jgi:peptide deformylase
VWPDPVLSRPTDRVGEITPEVRKLVDDMVETMYDDDGIGLAAPQVGVSLRVCVMDVAAKEDQGPSLLALINPEIVEREGDVTYEEGCLSFPGLNVEVKRAARVKVQALDKEGAPVELELEGLPAICVQHEIDHLDGVVFIDRLSPLRRRLALREYQRLMLNASVNG